MSGARFNGFQSHLHSTHASTINTQSVQPVDKIADIVSHLSINGNPATVDTTPNTPTDNSSIVNDLSIPPRNRQKSFREQIDDSDIPNSPTDSDNELHNQNSVSSSHSNGSTSHSSIDRHNSNDSIAPEVTMCPVSAELQQKIDSMKSQIQQFRSHVDSRYNDNASKINSSNSYYIRLALHDDEFVYRFLIARSSDVNKSFHMFTEAVQYRAEQHIDDILEYECPNGIELHSLAQQFIHKHDKYGRPVIYERVGSQDAKKLYSGHGFEHRCFYHQYYMEYLIRKHMVQVSRDEHHRITQVVIIVDMAGLSMSQATKTNYSFVKYVAKVNSLLYPEYMAVTYVINAPRIMSFMWNIVKSWLDEKTRKKIQIIHGSGVKELSEQIDINDVPKIFNGQCTCSGCRSGNMQSSADSMAFIEYMRSVQGKVDLRHNDNLANDILKRVTTGQ